MSQKTTLTSQQILTALKNARSELESLKRSKNEAIAIIGMACRLPGPINTLTDYWRVLINGEDVISEIPANRWDVDKFYDPTPGTKGKMYCRHGGFINDIEQFDAEFFGISAREADFIDPQQRLLLEVSWQALEHAGIIPERNRPLPIGVFVGISGSEYGALNDLDQIGSYSITGSTLNATAGRLAYIFGFEGPCMAIDTACSSSLVAVHQACQSLRQHESEIALAAGVNLILSPKGAVALSQSNVLSADGRCKAFSAEANGMGRSEGCAVLILKRLSAAEHAGDRILAVIQGSAVNQDGPSSGFTVPNGLAQAKVIRQALSQACIDPQQVDYIEAHGTGTALGDPIELAALAEVFANSHHAEHPLYVGSVKSNLGHAESAAGITSIIKVVLSLKEGVLPKNIHFSNPTPDFAWHKYHLKILTENQIWAEKSAHIAGVSGFGFSGTNAHIVLTDYQQPPLFHDSKSHGSGNECQQLLRVTAKSLSSLEYLAASYAAALQSLNETDFSHFCYTANTTRAHFKFRVCLIAANKADMIALLHGLRFGPTSLDIATVINQANPPISNLQSMDLEEIRTRYLAGEILDWSSLYNQQNHKRIDIPHYCFSRQSHWLPHLKLTKPMDYFYQLKWQVKTFHPSDANMGMMWDEHLLLVTDDVQSVVGFNCRVLAINDVGEIDKIDGIHGVIIYLSKQVTEQQLIAQCHEYVAQILPWLQWALAYALSCVLFIPKHVPTMTRMMFALFKSAHDEAPHLPWGCIEIEDASQIANAIHLWNGELFAAYREQQLYVASLASVPIKTLPRQISIRPDASYLITGGTGALGRQAAEALIELGAKHILLLSRQPMLSELLSSLQCSVLHVAIDVSDELSLQQLFQRFGQDLPPLAGVIHAAGISEDSLMQQIDSGMLHRVFSAKVDGSWYLHQLTQSLNLDFFVMYSSIATLLPAAGQGIYSAANAFMDDLASYRERLGLPGLSIQWGPWASRGMATTEVVQQRLQRSALKGFSDSQGRLVLQQLLGMTVGQIMAVDISWQDTPTHYANSLLSELMPKQAIQSRQLPLRERIIAYVQQTMKLSNEQKIDTSQPLTHLGLDSLMVVELRNVLVQELNLPLSMTLFYDYPTIDRLVDFLTSLLSAKPETSQHERKKSDHHHDNDAIAIIGLACRLPGHCHNADDFWQLLKNADNAVVDMQNARWCMDDYYNPEANAVGKMYSRKAGLLDDIEQFDPEFFGISPREAKSMDPQQRILLEVCWQALENAGYTQQELVGSRGGVFIGPGNNDYMQLQLATKDWSRIDAHMGTGNAISATAGRISFFLGWQGPALAIDTACSSSLVAVHQACQSLRTGESDHALAAGVNLILQPAINIMLSRAGMLSPEGQCKTFDKEANGYVRSEGCGVVMLKRLPDAIRDQDAIHAVIRGSAVNQDGCSQGLTAPNGPAQEAVIQQALSNSGYCAADVDYVETHGTGTKLGDPIEVQALYHSYVKDKNRSHPLYLGALKSNIGHAEAAAGIAGLIKTILAIKEGMIPANLHLKQLNPLLPGNKQDFIFPTELMPWPTHERPRVGAVSSFGFTGTNAHVIVESPPAQENVKRKAIPPYSFQREYCWLEGIELGVTKINELDEIKNLTEEEIDQLMNEMVV